jgi:hypothetical protein
MLSETITEITPWWFMSFVEEETSRFHGACIVQGITAHKALERSHELSVNPGGEAQPQPFPAGLKPPPEYRDKLLTLAECNALRDMLTQQLQAQADALVDLVEKKPDAE